MFGSYYLPYDEAKHRLWYGARLIYEEVKAGSSGVVYDRQSSKWDDSMSDVEARALFDSKVRGPLKEWYEEVRRRMKLGQLPSSSGGEIRILRGDVEVVGSPQGSFGYIYVSAAIIRAGLNEEHALVKEAAS